MSPLKRGEAVAAAGFLAPVMLFYAAFVLMPIVATVVFTFVTIDRFTLGMEFAGLAKYDWVYSDWRFWRTFLNTFYFIALAVTGNVGIGLLLAVLLNRALPRSVLYIFRLAYFFPVLVSVAFVSYIWRFLYGDDLGVFNYYLRNAGLPAVPWLSSTTMAMISIVILDVWKHIGFFMIILLAALQGVPKELGEAAMLDGAGARGIFLHVTLPYIAPVILFCVTYATIGGLQVFDSIRILTEGGPGDSTRSVVMYMLSEAFSAGDLSTGSVAALTLLIVVSAVVALQAWIARRWFLQ